MKQIIRIGMDTSKYIFQLHGVDAAEQPVLRRQLRRKQMVEFFAKLPPTVIGMEACGASHYWARELGKLGHEVKLGGREAKNDKDFIYLIVHQADRDRVLGRPIDAQGGDTTFRFDIVIRGRFQTPPDLD